MIASQAAADFVDIASPGTQIIPEVWPRVGERGLAAPLVETHR